MCEHGFLFMLYCFILPHLSHLVKKKYVPCKYRSGRGAFDGCLRGGLINIFAKPLDKIAFLCYTYRDNGVWLRLVERVVRVHEVAGSNPVTPTNFIRWASAHRMKFIGLSDDEPLVPKER